MLKSRRNTFVKKFFMFILRMFANLFNALAIIVGAAVIYLLLANLQGDYATARQQENDRISMQNLAQMVEANQAESAENWQLFLDAMSRKLNAAAYGVSGTEVGSAELREVASAAGFNYLAVYNSKGDYSFGVGCNNPDIRQALLAGEEYMMDVSNDDFILWFCKKMNDGRYLIGGRICTEYYTRQQELGSLSIPVEQVQEQLGSHILVLNSQFDMVLYSSEEFSEYATGDIFEEVPNDNGIVAISGVPYVYTAYESGALKYVSLAEQNRVFEQVSVIVILLTVVFVIGIVSISSYGYFVEDEMAAKGDDSKNEQTNAIRHASVIYKARNIMLLVIIGIFASCCFMQMLTSVGFQHFTSQEKLEAEQEQIQQAETKLAELTRQYEQDYTERGQEISALVKCNPALLEHNGLEILSGLLDVNYIYIFNENGETEVTNDVFEDFVLSDDPDSQSYPFWAVIKGYTDVLVQEAQEDSTYIRRMVQYIGVRRQDAKGCVQIGIDPQKLTGRSAYVDLDELAARMQVGNGGFAFVVDAADGTLKAWKEARKIGRAAATVGLTEKAMTDQYSGWQVLDGQTYYVNTIQHGDNLLMTAVPKDNIYSNYITFSVIVTVACLAITILIFAFLLLRKFGISEADKTDEQANGIFFSIIRNNRSQTTQDAASRWNGTRIRFRNMTAEQKLGWIFSIMATLFLILLLVGMRMTHNLTITRLIGHIMSKSWEYSLNIFAFSYVLITCLEIYVVAQVLNLIIGWLSKGQGTRSETVGRLIQNFIKYGAVIGALIYGLQFIGVNSTTIITGTGIMTLGISLGSQSLISDILAGIFIVFEGEFRVGDIITIDGFRGEVEEIGVRTTKVNKYGDIKIYRNSAISGVVNMTKLNSQAIVYFQVSYNTDLQHLKEVLEREFPEIRRRIPTINAPISYKGVTELADSGVTVMVLTFCEENNRPQTERWLLTELKNAMDRNGIEIPFPQVVVHKAQDDAPAAQTEETEEAPVQA